MEFSEFLGIARKFLDQHEMSHFRRVRETLRNIHPYNPERWVDHLRECSGCDKVIIDIDERYSVARNAIGRSGGINCYTCDYCANCCECTRCGSCRRYFGSDDTCSECSRCTDHCSCSRCAECGSDDEQCSSCDNCNDCCNCEKSPEGIRFESTSGSDGPDGANEKPTFHEPDQTQLKRNPSKRFLSPEVEINSLGDNGRNGTGKKISSVVYGWGGRIVEDGSLDEGGFEINVAPAGGDLFLRQMEEIFSALSDADADASDNCGMHVHVDARDFTAFDIRRLIMFYAIIEDVLFAMVPRDRRDSQYCAPCGDKFKRAMTKPVKSSREIRYNLIKAVYGYNFTGTIDNRQLRDKKYKSEPRYKKNGDPIRTKYPQAVGDRNFKDQKRDKHGANRYNALNLVSWFYRGSVECRLFPGTTDVGEATKWSMMWACILDYVQRSSDYDISRLDPKLKRSALLKALEGREELTRFVDDSIKQHGGKPDVFDSKPVAAPAPAPYDTVTRSLNVQRLAARLRTGEEPISDEDNAIMFPPGCSCDPCWERYAQRIHDGRENRRANAIPRAGIRFADILFTIPGDDQL